MSQSLGVERWGRNGRSADAESAKRAAIECHAFGTIHALGVDHPATVDSLQQLGDILERRGRLAEAEDCMRQALEFRLSKLKDTHGQIDMSRRELARLLRRRGKHEEAADLLKDVLHPGHQGRETFKANIARGGPEMAAAYTEDDLKTKRKERSYTLRDLGVLLSQGGNGDMTKAEDILLRSRAAREKLYGRDADKTLLSATCLQALAKKRALSCQQDRQHRHSSRRTETANMFLSTYSGRIHGKGLSATFSEPTL